MIRFGSCVWGLAIVGLSVALAAASVGRAAPPPIVPGVTPEAVRLYRDERAGRHAGPGVTVLLTGDILLGRGVEAQPGVFERVARRIRAADLAAGNLEGVITPGGADSGAGSAQTGYLLRMPPQAATLLQQAGFDLIGVANNHAADGGARERGATVGRLARAGLRPLGVYENEIRWVRVRGVRLAFLAFNAVAVPGRPELVWDREQALARVRAAAGEADGVIVLMHWGSEYETQAGQRQRDAARALAQAGADLIVGAHPHVVQGSEVIERDDGRRAFVAYSLGNFVFDQRDRLETRRGAVLEATFGREGLAGVQALAVDAGPRPAWLSGEAGSRQLARLKPAPQPQMFSCSHQACMEVRGPQENIPGGESPESAAGPQAIDLDGDGRAEQVLLEGGRAVIRDGDRPVWISPPEWRVHDLALGDPNDDGRFEALLALTRADPSGVARSHPFIIGFRGGSYRQVWGGSATADPIAELVLGDVDGDGRQEMIVLEERCSPADLQVQNCDRKLLSAWRWNGWGFTQFWKSPIGNYHHLTLAPQPDGTLWIQVERTW